MCRVAGNLTIILITICSNVSKVSTGNWLSRNAACDLLLPPDAITLLTLVVQNSDDCTYLIAPYNGCCSRYDYNTSTCTIVQSDRFQLVNASASLEVAILSVLSVRIMLIYFNLHYWTLKILSVEMHHFFGSRLRCNAWVIIKPPALAVFRVRSRIIL